MNSRRGGRAQVDHLAHLRDKHKEKVPGEEWGCICENGLECLYIVLIAALNKSEQEVIVALRDLRNAHRAHGEEVASLSSQISGLEIQNRRLEQENDALQQKLDSSVH